MMNIKHLTARDNGLNSTHVALLTSLLILVLLGLVLIGALMFLRSMRRARKQAEAQLPLYEKRQSNHSRLTITAMPYKGRESVVVYSEKEDLMGSSPTTPTSPVPEIRITFPDEVDESGKRQSGRVVVVRVGEHSVGLEPVNEDLPPYQRDASDRFDSLDLDRIGGLKEKDSKYYS
ncbi:Nn.00g079100.m01.CDS01 [Neocucurbitaria sp. VM-36]